MSLRYAILSLLLILCDTSAFTLVMMGSRRGKGDLKRRLDPGSDRPANVKALNRGKGQEITGVSLPADGAIKGWEFGNKQRMACANVGGTFYAVQGECPRCAFDLFKGTVVTDEAFGPDLPRVACPTCSTTFSLRTGKHGPALKQKGLAGFVGGLAKTATVSDAMKDAKAFVITRDEDGRVYCRER